MYSFAEENIDESSGCVMEYTLEYSEPLLMSCNETAMRSRKLGSQKDLFSRTLLIFLKTFQKLSPSNSAITLQGYMEICSVPQMSVYV